MSRRLDEAEILPRQPGERFYDYLERIAIWNGWMRVRNGEAELVRSFPAAPEIRLPYREPGDDDPSE